MREKKSKDKKEEIFQMGFKKDAGGRRKKTNQVRIKENSVGINGGEEKRTSANRKP